MLTPLVYHQSLFFGLCLLQQHRSWAQMLQSRLILNEPSIIWFVIAAKKREKKTAALRRIRKPIEQLQKRLLTKWKFEGTADKDSQPSQLIVNHFSFEELHAIMCRNRGQVLGLFDEMSTFYGQLDLYKHSSTVDRKTLLTLNGGGSWARNYKSYSASMEKTAFNVTGFIQPAFVYEMLNEVPDADGLNDRQLFDFPPERDLLFNILKSQCQLTLQTF